MIDRASSNDMMQSAADVGPVPMQVGAVLVLDPGPGLDSARIREVLADRLRGVPRLRQRLVDTPFGCGRPIWVDQSGFDVDDHVHSRSCPAPGDETALLGWATEMLGTRLPRRRPPWAATVVTGLEHGRIAVVVVFDHVLADGIGGLAVLANLVDGAPEPVGYGFPRPIPPARAVAADALVARLRAVTRWRAAIGSIRSALAELRPGLRTKAPRTSLNRPTGSRRATRVVRTDLASVHRLAHAHGATVNDVVLAVLAGALRDLLVARGEDPDRFVISVPVSARRRAGSTQLGNAVGVMPVEVPARGDFGDRLDEVARNTRRGKEVYRARESTTALVQPLLRALAWLGILRGFMNHQRLVNTIVTNLRGPDETLALAGAPIREVIPLSAVTGNLTVGFAVLSYAGSMVITIDADPDACPDLDDLTRLVRRAVDDAIVVR